MEVIYVIFQNQYKFGKVLHVIQGLHVINVSY